MSTLLSTNKAVAGFEAAHLAFKRQARKQRLLPSLFTTRLGPLSDLRALAASRAMVKPRPANREHKPCLKARTS